MTLRGALTNLCFLYLQHLQTNVDLKGDCLSLASSCTRQKHTPQHTLNAIFSFYRKFVSCQWRTIWASSFIRGFSYNSF